MYKLGEASDTYWYFCCFRIFGSPGKMYVCHYNVNIYTYTDTVSSCHILSLCILEPFRKNSRFWSFPRWAQLGWHTQCKAFLGGEHWTGLLRGLLKQFWKGMSLQITKKEIHWFIPTCFFPIFFPRNNDTLDWWMLIDLGMNSWSLNDGRQANASEAAIKLEPRHNTVDHGKVINIMRGNNKQDSWNNNNTARGLIWF